MRSDEMTAIRNLPLFRSIGDDTFDSLMTASYWQEFPPRLDLFQQGHRADFLHILVEGTVHLHTQGQGGDAIMAVVRPVSSFILAACFLDLPYLMSARTQERSRILMLPAVDLRAAIGRDPSLALAVICDLSKNYRFMVRQAKNLKLRNARERLIAWLLVQAKRAANPHTFVLPGEKRHLASFLGMTPESLSRAFGSLKPEGVVLDGSRVIIADCDKLAAIVALDPLIDDYGTEDTAGQGWGQPVQQE